MHVDEVVVGITDGLPLPPVGTDTRRLMNSTVQVFVGRRPREGWIVGRTLESAAKHLYDVRYGYGKEQIVFGVKESEIL